MSPFYIHLGNDAIKLKSPLLPYLFLSGKIQINIEGDASPMPSPDTHR